MSVITLFHGTSSRYFSLMQEGGIKENSCLTSSLELAEYYAECATDQDVDDGIHNTEPCIIECKVKKSDLVVDYSSWEEPISIFRKECAKSDEEWHCMIESGVIPYPKNQNDADTALKYTYSVRCLSKITDVSEAQ